MARYGVTKGVLFYFKNDLPLGTFMANLLACLVLGLALGKFEPIFSSRNFWYFMVIVGFTGGFSTFSTFSFETLVLMKNGQMGFAIANIVFSVAITVALLYYLVYKIGVVEI